MNNTHIILLSTIGLLVAAILGIYFYMPSNNIRFALADMNVLVTDSKMGKDLTKEINSISEDFTEAYKEALGELGKMQEELKNKKSVVSEEEFSDGQMNIIAAQNQLRNLVNGFSNYAMGKFSELSKHISEEVGDILPDLMKKYNFSLLFSSENTIYFNDHLDFMIDITSEVVSKLDSMSTKSPLDLSKDSKKWKEDIRELVQKAKDGKFTKEAKEASK